MKDFTDEFSFVLKISEIPGGGIGVFAVQAIKSGVKLALNKEGGESRVLDVNEVPKALQHFCVVLPDGKRKAPLEFNHLWIVWYLNHSDRPNAELRLPENNYYSTRDIREGEEILIDYNAFGEPETSKENYYKKYK